MSILFKARWCNWLKRSSGDARRPISRLRGLVTGASGAMLAVGLLGGTVVSGLYTDSGSVTDNQFSSGSVDISTTQTSAVLTMSGMLPGDMITAPITVDNDGTAQLRYAITSTTSEASLSSQMTLAIRSGVTSCTNANFNSSGASVRMAAILGTTGGTNVMGNPSQGLNTGDRTLNAGAGETLCFQAVLPTSVSSVYENMSTTMTLTFIAEQTANNA